jgi:hydroxypyruvate reductase
MKDRHLIDIFNAALAAVDPYPAVIRGITFENNCLQAAGAAYELDVFSRVLVVGAGKATARMALAIEDALGDRITEGLIVVKEGYTAPLKIIKQVEASHPVPNESGVEGTKRIVELVRAADEKTLVICLLSGGASALLVAPMNGLTLNDKQEVTSLLLQAGASIGELNAVRKHLSAVKGGRFAKAACPAQVVTMILSDVIGDRLDVIASGPTARDSTTFADAMAVIEKYGLKEKIPLRALSFLERGMEGQEPETVKSGDSCLHKTRNVIIGGITQALSAATEKARQLGFAPEVITGELQGEARDAARFLAAAALRALDALRPGELRCLLSGGETTVTVKGNGKGGRNQELALAFALEIEGLEGVSLLSAGTDGTDGPTDAAGAIVDGSTASRARALGIDPVQYLNYNDSYLFFQQFDELSGIKSHVITGPTGTNVMDLQIMLLKKRCDPEKELENKGARSGR